MYTLYKVFTKVIVNRLKQHMDIIVSPNQFGFIPNRSSYDNIVLAQEILHSMNRSKRKIGSFAIKIDISKDYDNMNWKFIKNVLIEVGIPRNLKELILLAITMANL